MPKLTKKAFEDHFREEVLPRVIERYGVSDRPARRQAWNDTVDSYIRDGMLSETAGNWGHPRWLETWRPSGARSHATKKPLARYWKVVKVDLINGDEELVAANFSTKADAEEAALDHLAASKSTRYLFKPKAQGSRPIKGPHDTY